jgi:pyruvate/2-oxoglutarate dehydrogenase complex dihydrolipoamide dehydrogenase (E3) component
VTETYDLIVVGAGSGDTVLDSVPTSWRTAIVEPARFGGTCLHRGCVPSKMLTATADVARAVGTASRFGVGAALVTVDWPAVRDRVFGRIDPLHDAMCTLRLRQGVDVFTATARFVGERVLQVGDDTLTADRIVLAMGSRPVVPDLPGLGSVPHHTSDTIMRVPALPASMIVVGGLTSVRPFADAAYGWALEDDTGFVKLIADARARTLVGAHVIGPQAPLLIQPLVQGMALGQTVDQLARDVLYIHPALTEVVELALLDL